MLLDWGLKAMNSFMKKNVIPYILAGYPDLEATEILLRQCHALGLTFIELGIPFSDPSADGPVIQAAASIASRTFDFMRLYQLLKKLKNEGLTFEFTMMTYANPLYAAGTEKTLKLFSEVGVEGLLIPDIPFEERHFISMLFSKKSPVKNVWMISENLSDDELSVIVKHSHYYLYLVSYLGTTGKSVHSLDTLKKVINKVKAKKDIPVVVGFGIRSKADADPILEFADGAIIGTQLINQLNSSTDKACLFLKTLSGIVP